MHILELESILEMGQVFLLQEEKTEPTKSVTDNIHSSCQALSTPGMCNRINSQIKSGCEKELLKSQVRKYSRACRTSLFSLISGSTSISMNPKGNFLCSPLPTKHSTEGKKNPPVHLLKRDLVSKQR